MNKLTSQKVIENILMSKMRGKVLYQGSFLTSISKELLYVKAYDMVMGKGYQRPVDKKRCIDFAKYLSKGDDALFPPILLNAASEWEFVPYDKERPNFGRLLCRAKASLMDGQHRERGAQIYSQETNSEINIPFLAFHFLDEDEEIRVFDTINTKGKAIGLSLSKYLRRDSDELSWVATELMIRKESPFHHIGTITGKRSKGRHVTLQNIYRLLHILTNDSNISSFSKEEKLNIALTYFRSIQELLTEEWNDYNEYRLSHIVCLEALSLAGKELLLKSKHETRKQIDFQSVQKSINKLKSLDWSVNGPLRYLKGLNGSKSLANDLRSILL
ncbi:hypothetical protein PAESOLCIP111_01312 [Paenibacillus solanacearum]|uniref:DGQHR domain-containing protein n=1 Tax=Paenibacillus solanacearum TaxID=2048548 RepID=A0A916JWK0_9BACL|nr:DGQHR domain-containing protein [Paenibacillus solanacearum]CAG7610954.1 hypothetical protein PAESOLCIP111_01312 [Paenibacillus solanacearum]